MTTRQMSDLLYVIERTEPSDVPDTFTDLNDLYDLIGDLPNGQRPNRLTNE